MKAFKLRRVSYSPGYGDMLGATHEMTLKKEKDGSWVLVCTDRELHSDPKVITTYAVSTESVAELETFLQSKKVLSLANRPKSDLFMTDYHPWNWSFDYEEGTPEKVNPDFCCFDEYKRYTRGDYALLEELRDRFTALRGEILSEEEAENT